MEISEPAIKRNDSNSTHFSLVLFTKANKLGLVVILTGGPLGPLSPLSQAHWLWARGHFKHREIRIRQTIHKPCRDMKCTEKLAVWKLTPSSASAVCGTRNTRRSCHIYSIWFIYTPSADIERKTSKKTSQSSVFSVDWSCKHLLLKRPIKPVHSWSRFRLPNGLQPPPPDSLSGLASCIPTVTDTSFKNLAFHHTGFFKADHILFTLGNGGNATEAKHKPHASMSKIASVSIQGMFP